MPYSDCRSIFRKSWKFSSSWNRAKSTTSHLLYSVSCTFRFIPLLNTLVFCLGVIPPSPFRLQRLSLPSRGPSLYEQLFDFSGHCVVPPFSCRVAIGEMNTSWLISLVVTTVCWDQLIKRPFRLKGVIQTGRPF